MKPKGEELKRITQNISDGRYKWKIDGHKVEDDVLGLIVDLDYMSEMIDKLSQLFIDTCTEWPEWFSEFVNEYEIEYNKPDCY